MTDDDIDVGVDVTHLLGTAKETAMAKKKPATNAYEDQDLKDIVAEIQAEEDEIKKVMASAMGQAAGHRKKIKAIKKRAKDDLGIPARPLNGALKALKLQNDLQKVAEDVPDDEAEVFEDMLKVLGTFAETPLGQSAIAASKQRSAAAKANEEAEQVEGEKVLDEMVGGAVN